MRDSHRNLRSKFQDGAEHSSPNFIPRKKLYNEEIESEDAGLVIALAAYFPILFDEGTNPHEEELSKCDSSVTIGEKKELAPNLKELTPDLLVPGTGIEPVRC